MPAARCESGSLIVLPGHSVAHSPRSYAFVEAERIETLRTTRNAIKIINQADLAHQMVGERGLEAVFGKPAKFLDRRFGAGSVLTVLTYRPRCSFRLAKRGMRCEIRRG